MSCSTLKRRQRHGRRRADNGSGPGQPTGHRNKFSCKANVDYPTVNVPGNYISREEADCYCFYLRPSTPLSPSPAFSPFLHFAILRCPILSLSLSLSLVLSRACHKLHGQTGATGPRIYQYPIRACTFPPRLVLSRSATFLVYALSSPAPRARPQVNRPPPAVFCLPSPRESRPLITVDPDQRPFLTYIERSRNVSTSSWDRPLFDCRDSFNLTQRDATPSFAR